MKNVINEIIKSSKKTILQISRKTNIEPIGIYRWKAGIHKPSTAFLHFLIETSNTKEEFLENIKKVIEAEIEDQNDENSKNVLKVLKEKFCE